MSEAVEVGAQNQSQITSHQLSQSEIGTQVVLVARVGSSN
jgi:hypothetical protein